VVRQTTAYPSVRCPCARAFRPLIEPLEVRRLLTASVVDGVLYVDGTDAADNIAVDRPAGSQAFEVTIGGEKTTVSGDGVRGVLVRGGDGDDVVRVSVEEPVAVPAGLQPRAGRGKPAVRVEGGQGNDTLHADVAGGAMLLGGGDPDRLTGGAGDDVLRGGYSDDQLAGNDGADSMWGGPGRDGMDGGDGQDRLRGGTGRDGFVNADAEAERLDFRPGESLLRQVLSDRARIRNGTLFITGTDDADVITVTQQQAPPAPDGGSTTPRALYTYTVRQGDRVLDSQSVSDFHSIRIDAGGGDDEVDVSQASGPVVGLGVTVLGGAGNDRILGSSGHDRLNGGEGNDHIEGGSGDDRLGGVYLGELGEEEPQPGVEFPAEPGNDVIIGGANDDVVDAGAGSDRVFGGDGADRLYGGADADEIRGEGGHDTFYTLDGRTEHTDRAADEPADDAFDVTPPSATFPTWRVQDGVLIIRGTAAGESIRVGQEVVPGSDPADPASVVRFFYSGAVGDMGFFDTIESDGSITSVRIEALGGHDVVDLNQGHEPTPGREFTAVTLPVIVLGGDGNDRVTGGPGNDQIRGGAGDDRLSGGPGTDAVHGEAGRDTFDEGDAASEHMDREGDEPLEQVAADPAS
jgi:Ca2+-binding RTX toxin-like protein